MIRFREEHQEKLKEARVAKCPICLMWFNNVLSAKHHARYNHTDIITSCKQLNNVYEIIEKHADKSQAIDYKKQEYTTQLREVQCFAHISGHMDCFTCSIKPMQKRLQQEKEKPIWQIVISDQDKMTQCSQPQDCHSTNMTQLDFTYLYSGKIRCPSVTPFKSAYDTDNGEPYKQNTFDYCWNLTCWKQSISILLSFWLNTKIISSKFKLIQNYKY